MKSWISFEWLKHEDLLQKHPAAAHPQGAVEYTPCFSVDLDNVLQKRRSHLPLIHAKLIKLERKGQMCSVLTEHQKYKAQKCIFALGSSAHAFFPNLKLGTYGGELINISTPTQLPAMYSINGLHIGQHNNGQYVFGASRWTLAQKPTLQAAGQKLFSRIPEILDLKTPQYESIWRGLRSVYHKDRLPITGTIPLYSDLFFLGAFGAKGLLWGPLAARYLAELILQQKSPPIELSSARIHATKWQSPLVL